MHLKWKVHRDIAWIYLSVLIYIFACELNKNCCYKFCNWKFYKLFFTILTKHFKRGRIRKTRKIYNLQGGVKDQPFTQNSKNRKKAQLRATNCGALVKELRKHKISSSTTQYKFITHLQYSNEAQRCPTALCQRPRHPNHRWKPANVAKRRKYKTPIANSHLS